jgi:hypothetical protein
MFKNYNKLRIKRVFDELFPSDIELIEYMIKSGNYFYDDYDVEVLEDLGEDCIDSIYSEYIPDLLGENGAYDEEMDIYPKEILDFIEELINKKLGVDV